LGIVTVGPGADLLAGEQGSAGRLWAVVEVPFALPRLSGALTLRGGVTRGDSLPQMAFRLGGPQTVRGFTYGERRGREFWSVQLDVGLGRSALLAPVVFFDIGDTFTSDPFIGAGAGVSLLNGLIRFNLSKGIRPDRSLRFDLLFRAPR
jgi:hemolysin activation/secretion protein